MINGKEKSAVTVARQRTTGMPRYRQRQIRRIIVNIALTASPIQAKLWQILRGTAMPDNQLAAGIVALRPFVPAKDFQTSKRYYIDLGFEVTPLGGNIANVSIGHFAFLLQDFFVQEWVDNFVMHMMVTNLDQWWAAISKLDLPSRYKVRAPRPPKLEPWGLRVAYIFDPAGVLWHFAEQPA